MDESKYIHSPQFRVEITRALANIVPSCTPEFVDDARITGIAFRLKDQTGQYRTGIVQINRYDTRVLQRNRLFKAIAGALGHGIPPPREIENAIHSKLAR